MTSIASFYPFQSVVELSKLRSSTFDFREMQLAAIETQKHFGLSNKIKRAVSGFQFNKELFDLISQLGHTKRIKAIADGFSQGSVYLGDYDYSSDEIEDSGDGSSNISLVEMPSRIREVNFLPVRLMQRIVNNPALMHENKLRHFEYFIADLINQLGFSNDVITLCREDGGRDIIARWDVNGIPMLYVFECKQHVEDKKIQLDTMRALLGTVSHAETKANKVVLVTTSSFICGVCNFIASETLVDGKDFHDLVRWINRIRGEF